MRNYCYIPKNERKNMIFLPILTNKTLLFLREGSYTIMKKIQNFFEDKAFGVCTMLGEKLGIATSSIRLFFIYASFLTFGSPVIIYLGLAFLMNIRKHLRKRKNPLWGY